MELLEFSPESFRDESLRLAKLVESSGWRPDCVAYLAKGAWQIGEVCADYFSTPVIELSAHRTGEAAKTGAHCFLRVLPRSVRKLLREMELRKRLSSFDGNSQKKTMRLTDRFELPVEAARILIVDDAADTGSSLIAAKGFLADLWPASEIKTAVINSFGHARLSGAVDYSLYEDVLLCTPMSKDSRYYEEATRSYKAGPQ